jgi:hypothetical protein
MQSRNGHIAFQLSVGPMHLVVHELINYGTCSSQNKQITGSGSETALKTKSRSFERLPPDLLDTLT